MNNMTMDQNPAKRSYLYLIPLIICAVGILAYANSLHNQFVYDDHNLVISNVLVTEPHSPGDIFKNGLFPKEITGPKNFYRPLQTILFRVNYRFWKLDPFGYHVTSMLLHIIACILMFYVLRIVTRHAGVAMFAALLYLVHPVHTESVSYIAGCMDPLSAIFLFVMMLSQYKFWNSEGPRAAVYYLIIAAALAGALLSKEYAFWFPVMLIFFEYCVRDRNGYYAVRGRRLIFYLPLFLIVGIWFIVKNQIVPSVPMMDKVEPLAGRFIIGVSCIAEYLRVSLLPLALYMEHRVPVISKAFGVYYVPRLIGSAIFIALVCWLWRRGREDAYFRVLFFGLGFFLLALFPYLGIFFPLNATFAEHWLYIPLMGLALSVVCAVFHKFGDSINQKIVYLFCTIIVILMIFTMKQNMVWKDEATFWEHTVLYAPYNEKAYYGLASEYIKQGRLPEAKGLLLKAIRIRPDYKEARESLIQLESVLPPGTVAAAGAGEDNARDVSVRLNEEGVGYGRAKELDKAIVCFNKAIEADPGFAESYNNIGFAYAKKGNIGKAAEYFKKTLEIDPNHKKARLNLDALQKQADSKQEK